MTTLLTKATARPPDAAGALRRGRRLAVQDYRLGLQIWHEALAAALAPDARLLEAAESKGVRVAVRVVPDRARADLPRELPGAVLGVREHRGVESLDRGVRDRDPLLLALGRDCP